jgi:hypothetical protein
MTIPVTNTTSTVGKVEGEYYRWSDMWSCSIASAKIRCMESSITSEQGGDQFVNYISATTIKF